MFCKFCGKTIDENALFCPMCGTKQKENESISNIATPDHSVVSKNKKSIKTTFLKSIKKLNLYLFGLIAGIIGVAIFLITILRQLITVGRIYLFHRYAYQSNTILIISIVLMMIGLCSIIIKYVLFFVLKIGKIPTTKVKNILLIALAVAFLILPLWSFAQCSNNNNNDYNSNYHSSSSYSSGDSTTKSITQAKAISYAKSSSTVQDRIAALYSLKFYYTPDWGTTTATKQYNGDWKVVLKGTISGYTDDYKSNYVFNKKFTVTVIVNYLGTCSVSSIQKNY